MKEKMFNSITIEGRVYDSSKLALKTSGPNSKNPGTQFIGGSLDIATDEEGLNIVTWYVTYVTERTASGGQNKTFTTLNNIINSGKTWTADGKDAATCVRINAAMALNDFYTNGAGNEETLVSQKRPEGGFIDVIRVDELNPDITKRAWFDLDAVLNSARTVEANEERNIPEHVALHGAAFNFRKDLLPFDVFCENPNGMQYFDNLDISNANQVFTRIQGTIVSRNIMREVTMESAFGDSYVKKVPSSQKKWLVTWAMPEPYLFDDDSTITKEELAEAAANREIHLAEVKKRQDDYRASQVKAVTNTMTPPAAGTFNF